MARDHTVVDYTDGLPADLIVVKVIRLRAQPIRRIDEGHGRCTDALYHGKVEERIQPFRTHTCPQNGELGTIVLDHDGPASLLEYRSCLREPGSGGPGVRRWPQLNIHNCGFRDAFRCDARPATVFGSVRLDAADEPKHRGQGSGAAEFVGSARVLVEVSPKRSSGLIFGDDEVLPTVSCLTERLQSTPRSGRVLHSCFCADLEHMTWIDPFSDRRPRTPYPRGELPAECSAVTSRVAPNRLTAAG